MSKLKVHKIRRGVETYCRIGLFAGYDRKVSASWNKVTCKGCLRALKGKA